MHSLKVDVLDLTHLSSRFENRPRHTLKASCASDPANAYKLHPSQRVLYHIMHVGVLVDAAQPLRSGSAAECQQRP